MTDAATIRVVLTNPNVVAFLRCIRHGESNQDDSAYGLVFGGQHFSDFSHHPYAGLLTTEGGRAAGAYQFLPSTWADVQKRYPEDCADFSPRAQDFAAVVKVDDRGALEDVVLGNLEKALRECRHEWTSLPGASESAPGSTLALYTTIYRKYGGTLASESGVAPEQPAAPVEDKSTEATPADIATATKGTNVPIALALMPLLAQLIPQLMGVFRPGDPVTAKASAAAQIISDAVTTATNQPNLQAAIQQAQQDPAVLQKAKDAVNSVWYQITEVGGGIQAARKSAVDQGGVALYRNVPFIVTMVMLPLIYMVVYEVLFTGKFSEQLETMVVTAVISGLLGSVTGYFLGSSLGSSKKDDTIQAQAQP